MATKDEINEAIKRIQGELDTLSRIGCFDSPTLAHQPRYGTNRDDVGLHCRHCNRRIDEHNQAVVE